MNAKLEETTEWIRENAGEFAQELLNGSNGYRKAGRPRVGQSVRNALIIEMIGEGKSGREIAEAVGASESTVSLVATRNGIHRNRNGNQGRPKGSRRPGIEERDAKLLAFDNGRRTLEEIGQCFGLTRERVRQIIKMHGGRPHAEIVAENKIKNAEQIERKRASEKVAREAKRLYPTPLVQRIAALYASGMTDSEIAQMLGCTRGRVGADIAGRYRKRWPHLFPYRRNWGGKTVGYIGPADSRPYHLINGNGK